MLFHVFMYFGDVLCAVPVTGPVKKLTHVGVMRSTLILLLLSISGSIPPVTTQKVNLKTLET